MLTKEQSIAEFDFQRQIVIPDRLVRRTHGHYLAVVEDLLRIYQDHVGEVRKNLHDRVRRRLQDVLDCPTRRIAAFCKLLDDSSEFENTQSADAARLRKRVFSQAAKSHPLVQTSDQLFDRDEAKIKAEIAHDLGMTWTMIEASLFADVIEFHRLRQAPQDLDATKLLARYNVAQTQAALYPALSMTVWASDDFKIVLRYAKLARLMHSISRNGEEYVFQFNGPASVLRQTRRYGVSFAKFLPGLLSARHWRMHATVLGPAKRRFALRLTSRDGLQSEIHSQDFDSSLEEAFFKDWQQLQTNNESNGWNIAREGTVLFRHQTVFMPDFLLSHPQHGEVLLEIVGFWTPEYLREKANRLRQFRDSARIVLAISETANQELHELDFLKVTFKTHLRAKQILALLRSEL